MCSHLFHLHSSAYPPTEPDGFIAVMAESMQPIAVRRNHTCNEQTCNRVYRVYRESSTYRQCLRQCTRIVNVSSMHRFAVEFCVPACRISSRFLKHSVDDRALPPSLRQSRTSLRNSRPSASLAARHPSPRALRALLTTPARASDTCHSPMHSPLLASLPSHKVLIFDMGRNCTRLYS